MTELRNSAGTRLRLDPQSRSPRLRPLDPGFPHPGQLFRSSIDPREALVTTSPQTASTPEPVVRAAATWGTLVSVLVPLVGALVAMGVLSSEQAAAITTLSDYLGANIVPVGVALVGGFGLVSGVLASFTTAVVGRRSVTPVPQSQAVVTEVAP